MSLADTSDYNDFSKELEEYAKLWNSNFLKEITSKLNKLLELFNLLNNGSNTKLAKKVNTRNRKTSTNESKNMLLEYIGYVNDKLFRKYSNGKNFSSFKNGFDCAT